MVIRSSRAGWRRKRDDGGRLATKRRKEEEAKRACSTYQQGLVGALREPEWRTVFEKVVEVVNFVMHEASLLLNLHLLMMCQSGTSLPEVSETTVGRLISVVADTGGGHRSDTHLVPGLMETFNDFDGLRNQSKCSTLRMGCPLRYARNEYTTCWRNYNSCLVIGRHRLSYLKAKYEEEFSFSVIRKLNQKLDEGGNFTESQVVFIEPFFLLFFFFFFLA